MFSALSFGAEDFSLAPSDPQLKYPKLKWSLLVGEPRHLHLQPVASLWGLSYWKHRRVHLILPYLWQDQSPN